MTTVKAWYFSRTVWASIVTIAVAVLGAVGLPVETIEQAALVEALMQGVAAIAGVIALFGRLTASSRIG